MNLAVWADLPNRDLENCEVDPCANHRKLAITSSVTKLPWVKAYFILIAELKLPFDVPLSQHLEANVGIDVFSKKAQLQRFAHCANVSNLAYLYYHNTGGRERGQHLLEETK